MQILILGMHRSGTSATARLVNMMGAYFAPEGVALAAKPDNPKGFWERRDVLHLNDDILKLQQCHWNKLANWRFEEAGRVTQSLLGLMHSLVQNMDAHRPWFMKDPRMCLTLPAWLPLLEAPIGLCVYRNPQEIALSLKNRNPISAEYGLAMWEFYTVSMLNHSMQIPRFFIDHADLMSAPVETCHVIHQRLSELGVRRLAVPGDFEIRAFIDPKLYRSRGNAVKGGMSLSPEQQQLCDIMQGRIQQTRPLQVSDASRRLIESVQPVAAS